MIFDVNAPVYFPHNKEAIYTSLAMINSVVAKNYLSIVAPTISAQVGDVLSIPYCEGDRGENIVLLSKACIAIAREDWDAFETSWDFQRHPLMRSNAMFENPYLKHDLVEDAYAAWQQECDERFYQLKANEEEINRIFIDIYGLQDELTPEVEDKDVTVRRADLGRDIRSLISYAVGCMFGRYSIYKPGLLFAGENYSLQAFVDKINDQPGVVSAAELKRAYYHEGVKNYDMFEPDKDNVIPICDDEYFGDDIVGRFVAFIKEVYGEETLEENLAFIAKALGGKGNPRDVIRSYFLNDFYADHLKIYQKRPIYWLFDSGKKNGFKALIYMHRYAPDTIARIRTDYVHEQQSRYRTAITDLENRINAASTGERVKLTKQLTKVQAQAEELRVYEEKIHHLADQMISIDLDDGVKVNYAKFADVLAKIK